MRQLLAVNHCLVCASFLSILKTIRDTVTMLMSFKWVVVCYLPIFEV